MTNNILLACSGVLGEKVLKNLHKNKFQLSVLTDKNSTKIINLCSKHKINIYVGNARNDNCYYFTQKYKNYILLSVNYLYLFEERMRDIFQYKFNVHGSLLPKYRGRTPHVWAIINNEKKTGITIHDIANECDAGDIYFQKEIPIRNSDTGSTILKKYFYHYPKIIKQFLYLFYEHKLVPCKQNEYLSTYFCKRTPEDGKILFDWQRERIYNWVRALAPPFYPGAFCFLGDKKIIINKILLSNLGFSCNTRNGMVLDTGKGSLIVKTQNGCIEVVDYYKQDNNIIIKKGDVLT